VNGHELAVVEGWADTRQTLRLWERAPGRVLWRWVPLSLAVSVGLLVAVWVVAQLSTPDATPRLLPGVNAAATTQDALVVFGRNLLVLALHSLACLAGFIAKSSLPAEAERYTGWWRRAHDLAGPGAIAFVTCATIFSLCTQAFVLGGDLSTMSAQFGVGVTPLLAAMSLHAVPELCALFLPLAAWLLAARAAQWHQLMAATIVTTAVALPVLVLSALVEVFVTPQVLLSLHFV
jgi:hypothetical protein